MVAISIIILLFLLLAAGVPVGFSMGVAGAIGLVTVGNLDVMLGVLQTAPLTTVSSYELITIPMFLLMAELVLLSGIADDLFTVTAAWIGHLRGGLGMATALSGAGFGAICGTSTASAATLSATTLPAMVKQGYDPKMAAGVVAVSGTLAMLIPPSVALIVYGLLADISIGKLLVGGIIPGLIVTFTIMATVWVLAVLHPEEAPCSARVSLLNRLRLLKGVGPMLLLMILVTGVIYSGIATPTEASALGATGALGIVIWRGRFNWRNLRHAVRRAAQGTCMIAMILLGAQLFGYFFTLTHVTQDLVAWVAQLPAPRWLIMVVLLSMYIVLGAFMDQIAILVLTVPVVVPMIVKLGFDPIWFGVIKIVIAEVGMITPPIGLNCYVVSRYANRPVGEVFHGTLPHILAHLLAVAVFLLFPKTILWLPSLMR